VPISSKRDRIRAAAALAMATVGVACSNPQSFVVLQLTSATTAITGIASVAVGVSNTAGRMTTLTYPATDLTLSADAAADTVGTLSVSFSGGQGGDVMFDVTAFDTRGCTLAQGAATITIRKGSIVEGTVPLAVSALPCPADGGAPDAVEAGTGVAPFAGCNPVSVDCPSGDTCQVDCTTRNNECVPAGKVAPAGVCQSTADCEPGAQCFDYGSLGCAVKLCLHFCGSDTDCAMAGNLTTATAASCRNPVTCSAATAYRTCTTSCDPTAIAVSERGGCAAGLACVMTGDDRDDCACPAASRTGREGASCASASNCAPGLICNAVSGVATCRSVCRCDESGGRCATNGACPTAGTSCTPVTGQTVYGVCL
jgi:hypothetical protein